MVANRVALALRRWLENGSQNELEARVRALGVDVTQSTISRIASGRQIPLAPTGVAVCVAIGLDPRAWLPGEPASRDGVPPSPTDGGGA